MTLLTANPATTEQRIPESLVVVVIFSLTGLILTAMLAWALPPGILELM
jgi:hypothetical protein